MNVAQYRALAGSGQGDSALTFRTDGGRTVLAGGGLAPDSLVLPPAALPVWFTAAADSGLPQAVADSMALALRADEPTRGRGRFG